MKTKLSYLVEKIQDAVQRIDGDYWVSAQVSNAKRYENNKRCYLTLVEMENGAKLAEVKAIFWSTSYDEIAKFEKATGQQFKDGIEIVCKVKVKFNKVYGLTLEVSQIDIAHAVGSLELQRRQTIERLVSEGVCDKRYKTRNNSLQLPMVIKHIALITAPGSDGQRDFIQEITNNKHGYTYDIKEFLTTIQGDNAHLLILDQLKLAEKGKFDVVAIVRGGGSQTDFKPFDDYELCKYVATFPIPVFTGIGHDRNQSIVDIMAREQKTPTKVASVFVDHNFGFENKVIDIREKIENLVRLRIWNESTRLKNRQSAFFQLAKNEIKTAKKSIADIKTSIFRVASDRINKSSQLLNNAKRTIKLSDPQNILNRGFAIVKNVGKVVTDPNTLVDNSELEITVKEGMVLALVHNTELTKEINANK